MEGEGSVRRVRNALAFEEPDFVPLFENYWGQFAARWREAHGLAPLADLFFDDVVDDLDLSAHYGVDMAIAIPDETPWPSKAETLRQERDYTISRDGWGRTVRTRPGASFAEEVDVALKDKLDLDRLEFEPPESDLRYTAYLKRVEDLSHGEYRPHIATKVGGPYLRSSRFRGEACWLMDIAEDPEFVQALCERVTDHLIAVGLEAVRRSGLQHTSLWIFDDCACNQGLLMSPRAYERLFLPQVERMVRAFKGAGVALVGFHSDGDIRAVLDGLVDAGIGAINPVEPRANMDVVDLRERYGRRLALVGGLCNSWILPCGSPAEVRTHVEHVLRAGEGGGLVIGSHSVGPDISLERYEYVMRLLAEHGRPLPPSPW